MDTNNRLRDIYHGLSRSGRYTEFVDDSDLETFDRRIANEGAEFYARGLTSLRAAFLKGLEKGQYEGTGCRRFKTRRNSLLPAFLYRAHSAIFHDSGLVRDTVNADAVACLNQLLAVFGKIEGGHTKESETEVVARFLRNEEKVKAMNRKLCAPECYVPGSFRASLPSPLDRYKGRLEAYGWDYILQDMVSTPDYDNRLLQKWKSSPEDSKEAFGRLCEEMAWEHGAIQGNYVELFILEARRLVRRVLADVNPRDIDPKHGSGASACGTQPYQRYDMPRYVERIDRIYPYAEYYFLGASHLVDVLPPGYTSEEYPSVNANRWLEGLEAYEPCAKVLLVPKDARGPRMISCEPRETMWIQQGVLDRIVTCLEAHSLTRGLINFSDQTINKHLAYRGSITRETATLDLTDASDLVPWELVKAIFPENWVECLDACRSRFTELPDGTVVELGKFAPMGSALCFPVMALTIWAILTAAANMSQTEKSVKASGKLTREGKTFKWKHPVYVYGDDIVVPTAFAVCAKLVLEAVGLEVSSRKCFVRSLFRESCGGEYYNGHDVTPVRLRCMPDDDIPSRMKIIAFHNNLCEAHGLQPIWLTQLIHSWYPKVPEKTMEKPWLPNDTWREIPSIFSVDGFITPDQTCHVVRNLTGVLEVYQPCNSHLPSRFRREYHRREYRYLAVVPKGFKYPKDRWCQVFRAVVNPRREMILGWDALAKRVSYKYRWAPLH